MNVDGTVGDLTSIDSSQVQNTDLGAGADETTFESLSNKINISTDEITLSHDYSFDGENDGDYIDGIVISKPITINGNGFSIDGKSTARIFNIVSGDVTLKNITFINAFHDLGGALYITGKDVKIIDCTFINNKASVEAGAVYLVAPHGQIINSKIINSSAVYTGAVLINSVNASVIGCYFENNSANISAGALGWAAKDNGTIRNCVFINNSAYNEGGGAIFWNNGKNGIIENSTFKNNYANFNGSAIFGSFGENGKIMDSIFINNTANVTGGAIYLKGDDNEMVNCNFTNNSAGMYGGAVYWLGNNGLINHCNFLDNVAEVDGGALRLDGNNNIVDNCHFKNNAADSAGAIFIKNAENTLINSSEFFNNRGRLAGAVYLMNTLKSKITYCNFKDNCAEENNGGAMFFRYVDNYTLSHSNFTNNIANINGGAIYTTNGECGLISYCNFNNNTAVQGDGGALNWNNPNSNLTYCNFTNNHGYDSGAIDTLNPNGRITYCNFINNSVESAGGAISYYGPNGLIYGCNFIGNTAPSASAGAVYWLQSSTNGTIDNCNFINNVGAWGGAIRWEASTDGKVINSRFINCTATDLAGAVYWRSSKNGEVSNCTFIDCDGDETGGAVYWRGGTNGLLSNCTFTNTTAEVGGAVFWTGDDGRILNCNFNNIHTETTFGGVIEVSSSNAEVKYCTVKDSDSPYSLCADGYYRISGLVDLEKNNFDKFIRIQDGGIVSPTYIILSGENGDALHPVELKAVIKDDNENVVIINKKLTFVISDGSKISTSCGEDGYWSVMHTFNKSGEYMVTADISNFDNLNVGEIKVEISRVASKFNIAAGQTIKIYAVDYSAGERGNDINFRLTDTDGNPIGGATVNIAFKTSNYRMVTDANGYVSVSISTPDAGKSLCVLSFLGDDRHDAVVVPFTFNIQKKTITIKAKAKTFKAKTKTKKFTVTLKTKVFNSKNKKVYLKKGKKVTLKIKGKTFKAKTNAKGKATFKIKKLTKKGRYVAKIRFAGDNTYKSASKKVKITIK